MKNPEIIAELKRVAAEHGGQLRPSAVVDAARSLDSPLHNQFEWDDTEAAQRYRLWQARQLLSVTVEYIGSGDQARMERVFVSLSSDRIDDRGYRTTVAVMSNPIMQAELLADALAEMQAFAAKYSGLQELAAVFAEMARVPKPTVRVARSKRRAPEAAPPA